MRGMTAAMVFVAGVSVYSVAGKEAAYKTAKATVFEIDRECNFIETTRDPDGRTTARGVTDSCNSTDEWSKIREKRSKKISGKAVVHVSYTAPQDGSSRTAELRLTGADDEFYEWKVGDEVQVLVSNTDPAKIRKV